MAWQSTGFQRSLPGLEGVMGFSLWSHPLGTEDRKGPGVLKTKFSRSVLPMLCQNSPGLVT